jgi:hypothetical protein
MRQGICFLTTFLIAAAGSLQAQQVVAPTPDAVGSARGENAGDYNITNSFETGYRWSLVGGDLGMYRSDVNYGNGLRLLGSSLTVESRDGHGRFFDEIVLNTTGLGNDPYQAATLRVRKNGLYEYDMTWRLDDFYNPGLDVSGGAHLMDTTRHLQDHDLTLFPQGHFQIDLGYSRNTQSGPALTTAQEFDTRSSAFPVFENVNRQWNEYRLGLRATFAGFTFIARHTWDFYRDNPSDAFNGLEAAGTQNDLGALTHFQSSQPAHGANPGWLGNLFTRRKLWAVNARMTYVAGHGDFALDQSATGTSRFGATANQQVSVSGNGQRPDLAGDFNVSLFPLDNLTIVNSTSVHNLRISGDNYYSEYDNGTGLAATFAFAFLGVRTIANNTDIQYRWRNWIGFFAGYDYSERRITETDASALPSIPGTAFSDSYAQESHLNEGRLGVRLRPAKPLTITLDGEVGRTSKPLDPISDANYHALNGRVQYRTRRLQTAGEYRQVYNLNAPLSLTYYSSHSRTYSGSASWSPRDWFSIDATYNKLHLDTASSLQFFAGILSPQLQTGYSSLYVSNIHAGNLGIRFALARRVDVYVGYSITKDVGDGRASAVPAGTTNAVQALLGGVQTFPLTYQSPLARLSVRISPKVRWNAGYQFYGYGEQFHLLGYDQNYNAHAGYTSLLWSF